MGVMKHGLSGTRTYKAWIAMIYRCTKPEHPGFKYYGQRGIRVCERWKSFENFIADMGECPHGLELDRTKVNGHYEPGNCEWVTKARQSINKRKSLYTTIDGISVHVQSEAKRLGISDRTVYSRYKSGVRGAALFAKPEVKRCPHDRTGSNLYVYPDGRRRGCRACNLAAVKRYKARMTA